MNTLNDVLTPLQTKIAFVSANNPGGGGGGTVPQTGDAIGIILAIIAALAVICVATYSIVSRQKIASARSIGIVDADISFMQKSRRRITLALSALVAICLASLIWIYLPLHSAIAGTDGDVTGSDTVYAHVDETTGAVTVDDGVIKNQSANDLYFTSATLNLIEDEEDESQAPTDLSMKITALDSTIFNGKVGEKWTEDQITLANTLKAGQQTAIHYEISPLKVEDARYLIGKTAYYVEFEEANCYSINYDINGADEGTAPNVTIKKDGDTAVTVASPTEDMQYWGFSFTGWNTQKDGKGTPYAAGAKYEANTSVVLYAQWQENSAVEITYKVADDCKDKGQVKLIGSATASDSVFEKIAPRTGTAVGAEAVVSNDTEHAFVGWFLDDESLGNSKQVFPEKNDHKCYENKTYVARFVDVVTAEVKAKSDDESRGEVAIEKAPSDIYTGSTYTVVSNEGASIITITNIIDQTKTTIIASAKDNYFFEKWVYVDSKGVEHSVGKEGTIEGNITFVASFFSNEDVDINIKVGYESQYYETPLEQGYFKVGSGSDHQHEYTIENASSSAEKLTKLTAVVNSENIYNYKFAYWELKFSDSRIEKVYDAEFTPTRPSDQPWVDGMTITCYFEAPKALYTRSTSSLKFVYDSNTYVNTDDLYVYRVFPDTYVDIQNIYNSKFPDWYFEDGTPKIYPRYVNFDPSFKNFTELESTCFWFCDTYGNEILPFKKAAEESTNGLDILFGSSGMGQGRVLQSVEGLENVYTEKISDTSFMFTAGMESSLPLETLDFSSWNLPNVKDMTAMFCGNAYLSNLILPSDTEGHYFGANTKDMKFMFAGCTSLRHFEIKGDFGANAQDMSGMFAACIFLSNLDITGNFGAKTTNASQMFFRCQTLYEVNISGNFGKALVVSQAMFARCVSLLNVNFNNNSFGSLLTNASQMFEECYSLTNLDLSTFAISQDDYCDGMFYDCYNLMQIKIGTKFLKSFEECALYDTYWYISDTDSRSYDSCNVPLLNDSNNQSMPYTYRMQREKAVYDKLNKVFTFTSNHFAYDAEQYDLYYVPVRSGFVAGGSINNGGEFDIGYFEQQLQRKSSNENSDSVSGALSLLPPWYRFTGDNPLYEYIDIPVQATQSENGMNLYQLPAVALISNFECLVDAQTVEFKSSFKSFTRLLSTSGWFMADSYGKQTFKNFKGLDNIPSTNLETVACMFGGFSFDLIKDYNEWARESKINYAASIFDRIRAIVEAEQKISGTMKSIVYSAGNRYDTYGTSITEIDITDFAPLISSVNNKRLRFGDLSGLFANCSNLVSVKFPADDDYELPRLNNERNYKELSDASQDLNAEEQDNELSAQGQSSWIFNDMPPQNRGGFNALFYNCAKLKNIENFDAMIRHYNNMMKYLAGNYGYSFHKTFSGCRSLEAVDLRDFPVLMVVNSNGMWNLEGMFENCDHLSRIYLNDGYDDPYRQISPIYMWRLNFDITGIPEYSDYDIYWDNYVRLNGNDTEDSFADSDSPDPEYPTKAYTNLTSKDIPVYTDNWGLPRYLSGMFYRDLSNLDDLTYTVDFTADPADAGKVYYDFDKSEDPAPAESQDYVTPVTYYVEGDSLFVDGVKYSAKAADGYKLSHWEINGTMISKNTNYGKLEEVSKDSTFTAHFEHVGMTAKAVYDTKTSVGPSLTFYYDNRTAASIIAENPGVEVFEVNPATFFDGKYDASLPTWMELVYKGKTGDINIPSQKDDSGLARKLASDDDIVVGKIEGGEVIHVITDKEPLETSDRTAYRVLNKNGFYDYIYNESWQIKWIIEPKAIVFDKSFAAYDSLESISGWFMADDYGNQPVTSFYSHDENGYHGGDDSFKYLNTTNLSDVAFAFGGITRLSDRYYNNKQIWYPVDAPTVSSAFDIINGGSFAPGVKPGLYGNEYNTYGNSITSLNLKSFNMDNLKSLNYMFANALQLNEVIFPDPSPGHNKILSNCTSMIGTFYACEGLGRGAAAANPIVNLDKFDTSKVEYMDEMFFSCDGLTTLDLRSFNTENLYYDRFPSEVIEFDPTKPDVDYHMQAFQMPTGMFYDCVRLSTIYLNSEYDTEWWSRGNLTHVKGWTVNMQFTNLPNHETEYGELNPWKCDNKEIGDSSCIPYSLSELMDNAITPETKIYSGKFTLRDAIITHNVNFVVDDTDDGGLINGKEDTYYDFVDSCGIHKDNQEENVLWAENSRYVAQPKDELHRFAYWTFGDGFGDRSGEVVPNDYSLSVDRYNYENELTFVAHFTDDLKVAKAIFYAENNKGTMKFVYDQETYVVGQDGVKAVYNINSNCNDYNLPAWYISGAESWDQDDDHTVANFDPVIENNAPEGISVEFDETFKAYDKLNSMSCWFMPTISNKNPDTLYAGFSSKPYPDFDNHIGGDFAIDLSNVNMKSLKNVKFMFGGYQTFSDFGGTTVQKFDIKMPQNAEITNLDGLFANCVWLNEVNMNGYDSSKITSMRETFFNCPTLFYEYGNNTPTTYLGPILRQFNTSKVEDMTGMFAQYTSNFAREYHPVVKGDGTKETYKILANFPTGSSFTTANVKNMKGIFSGFYNANCIEINGPFDVSKVDDMTFMFANNPWIEYVKVADQSMRTPNATCLRSMFDGDTYLGHGDNGNLETSACIKVGENDTMHLDNATDLHSLFYNCSNIKEFDLPRARCTYDADGNIVNAIQDANGMLAYCTSLEKVDLTNYYIIKQSIPETSSGSSTIGGGSGHAGIGIRSYPSYNLFKGGYVTGSPISIGSPEDYKLKEIVLGRNDDTTETWNLQFNTEISLSDLSINSGATTRNADDRMAGTSFYYAWNNVDTAASGSCYSIPWLVSKDDRKTDFDNPFGTYVRQNRSIEITSQGVNHDFEYDRMERFVLGYGNGFTATYSYTDLQYGSDNSYRILSVTLSSTSTNASHTYEFKYYVSNGYNINFGCMINNMPNWDYPDVLLSGSATEQNAEELFDKQGIEEASRYFVYFYASQPGIEAQARNKVENNNAGSDAAVDTTAKSDASVEDTPSLQEEIDSQVGDTAFKQMVNPDAPVVEVATAALSLLSFTVPWEFFTMCLEIIF